MRIPSLSFYISSHLFRDLGIEQLIWIIFSIHLSEYYRKFLEIVTDWPWLNNFKLTNSIGVLDFECSLWPSISSFLPFSFSSFDSLHLVNAFWCNYLSCEEFIPPHGVKTHYNLGTPSLSILHSFVCSWEVENNYY